MYLISAFETEVNGEEVSEEVDYRMIAIEDSADTATAVSIDKRFEMIIGVAV